MPFNDGISRTYCFSLTDFHDFDFCQFRFFVRHHLDKKYELTEGNEKIALGSLLDQTIKIFHSSKAYGQPSSYVKNLVLAAKNYILEYAKKGKQPNFYTATVPFLTDEVVQKAINIFQKYYESIDRKINPTLGEVGFCEWIISTENGAQFKLWGGPDVFEMGSDGIPEVVDYKSRENIETGKLNIDMDLMPKLYVLLSAKYLLKWYQDLESSPSEKLYGSDSRTLPFAGAKGRKVRFKVRFWQDPLDESYYQEFDLENLSELEKIFEDKIKEILQTKQVLFCNKGFCIACQSDKRVQYITELAKLGLTFQDQGENEDLF